MGSLQPIDNKLGNPFSQTQQPPTFGSASPFSGGAAGVSQHGTTNPFGSATPSSVAPSFGHANISTPTGGSFPQFSQPQTGAFSTTGGSVNIPAGGGFGKPAMANQFSFGQQTSLSAQPTCNPFGGMPTSSPYAPGQQSEHGVSESSNQHVCVRKETLERLTGVEWTKVSEGSLFHELPDSLKTVLVDVNTRILAEQTCQESVRKTLTETSECFQTLDRVVLDAGAGPHKESSKRLTLSASISSAIEAARRKSAAAMRQVEEQQRTIHHFHTLVQRSLRSLLDAVCARGKAASDAIVEDNFALLDSVSHDLTSSLRWLLMRLQCLAIQWPAVEGRSASSLREVVDGLRAVFRGVCGHFSTCHDLVKRFREDFGRP